MGRRLKGIQLQAAQMFAADKTAAEVAEALGISVGTARTYATTIRNTAGSSSTREAAQRIIDSQTESPD